MFGFGGDERSEGDEGRRKKKKRVGQTAKCAPRSARMKNSALRFQTI